MTDEELLAHAAQAARLLDLKPDAVSLAAVAANLKILRGMAAEFENLPLDDHLDPAPVLRL
jgi:hypothetical protein